MKTKIMRPWALAAVTAATLVAMNAPDLKAYVLGNMKWPTNQVLYYVNARNAWVSDSAALEAIKTAAAGWTNQTRADISLVYGGATSGTSAGLNYKSEVFFRSDGGGGYTYWWWDGGKVVDFDIILYDSAPYFTGTTGCSGNGLYIEDLATHEFGHALGILHSDDAAATMYTTTNACDMSWRELSPDDTAAIEALYPPSSGTQTPSAPSGLQVATNGAAPTSSLLVSWGDNSNNESGFRIERRIDGGSFTQIGQVDSNVRSYTSSGLAAGTLYYYRVFAYNSQGTSASSNVSYAQTEAQATGTASDGGSPSLTVRTYKVKTSSRVELTWTGSSAASVDVYKNGVRLRTTTNDGLDTDSINKRGGTFVYKVCNTGSTACSNEVSVTF